MTSSLDPATRPRFRSYLLILTALALLGTSYFYARSLGMAQSLPPHSFTRAQMSIGISISKLTYGAEGYLLLTPVINSLIDNGFNGKQISTPGQINRAIEAARSLRLDDGPVVAERDWGDDKGYSDFTTLAFRIFGFQIEALFSMYFAMLGAAFVFFTIRFYEDCLALFFLAAFFAAHLLVVQILPNSGVTSVVHDSRFLPTISCVSMFHWLLAIVRKNHRPRVEVPLLIAQAAVIVFVLNGRSSSIWQVWAIGFFLTCAALWAYLRDERARFRQVALLLGILVASVMCLKIYKSATYDAQYRSQSGTQAHVVWHNVYMGLGFHPEAIEKYDLLPDDSTVYRHAFAYLRANTEALDRLGLSEKRLYEPVFEPLGWGGYDKVVKEMLLEFLRKDPKYVAEVFLLYKPRLLLEELAWQAGLKREFPTWVKMNPVHGPAGNLRIHFFSLPVLITVLLALAACKGELLRKDALFAHLAIGIGALFSLVPSFAVGPFYYELPVVFLIFTMLTIVAVGSVAVQLTDQHRWRNPLR